MKNQNEKYRRTEDGTLLVRKPASGWHMGMTEEESSKEMWYQCSEKPADRQFVWTVLGGWFGLHKFQEGKPLQGIFYLLTCGCYGVFYLCDLFAMLCGDYSFKKVMYTDEGEGVERKMHRVYYGPMENKRMAAGLFIFSLALLPVLVHFIYQPVGQSLLAWLAAAGSDRVTQESVGQFIGFIR